MEEDVSHGYISGYSDAKSQSVVIYSLFHLPPGEVTRAIGYISRGWRGLPIPIQNPPAVFSTNKANSIYCTRDHQPTSEFNLLFLIPHRPMMLLFS